MKTIYRIARTELQTLFYSPVAWLIIVIFTFQAAMVFSNTLSNIVSQAEAGYSLKAITRSIFGNIGFFPSMVQHLYLYIPLLTMSLISRELGSGSIKLLYSSPVTNVQIILGKFLSMMIFGLILVGILLFFILFAGFHIEHFGYPAVLIGLLGIYLLICTYAAVGLFMSSLTSYQIVAAILTFIILSALNYIKVVWQEIEFVREITYWLSMSGRVSEFLIGLLCSEDFLYFIIVTALFLSLAIIRLQACRQKTPWTITYSRYIGIIALACSLGYLSSRPMLMGYYDATKTKSNTLTKHSQEIVSKLDGGLTITTYVNLLDENNLQTALPKNVKTDHERFRQYTRFKPEIKMKYVYYYDTIVSESLDKRYPNTNTKQKAQRVIQNRKLDSTLFITPQEIRSQIDLWPEGNRFVRLLERESGEKTFLRVYADLQRHPGEREITAAFKRLVMKLPKVGFLTGHGERDIQKIGERDYQIFAQEKSFRYALINQGFDVEEVTLDQEIPEDITILVIAEPRQELDISQEARLQEYIARGDNLFITCEPRRIETMRSLLAQFGVEQIPGRLVRMSKNYTPDLIQAYPTKVGCKWIDAFTLMRRRNYVIVASEISGLNYSTDKGYDVVPLFITDSLVWNELETTDFVDDIPVLNPAKGERQGQYATALALKRPMRDKEQKIIILGDSDYMSNGELNRKRKGIKSNNFNLITGGFYWLSNEEVPINIVRPNPMDNKINISSNDMGVYKIIMTWGIPGLLLLTSIFIWLRRRGR